MIIKSGTFVFFASFCIGLITTFCMRLLAIHYDILDRPSGNLKVHKEPVPYLGGLGVALGVLISSILFLQFNQADLRAHASLVIGMIIVLFVGLYDDLYSMTPKQKFIGQCIAVAIMLSGFQHHFLSTWLGYGIAYFFLLTLMNAFNLIDIMDGLATTAAVSSVVLFLLLTQQNQSLRIYLLILAGVMIGFFMFNKPNARMYLGDAGALLYGALIGIIPFFLSWTSKTSWGLIGPLFFVAVPLLEVASLIFIRLYLSLSPFQGSPHHFAILMQKKGYTKWAILLWVFVQSFMFGSVGIRFITGQHSFCLIIIQLFFVLVLWFIAVIDFDWEQILKRIWFFTK